jgi:hypothetical protein
MIMNLDPDSAVTFLESMRSLVWHVGSLCPCYDRAAAIGAIADARDGQSAHGRT